MLIKDPEQPDNELTWEDLAQQAYEASSGALVSSEGIAATLSSRAEVLAMLAIADRLDVVAASSAERASRFETLKALLGDGGDTSAPDEDPKGISFPLGMEEGLARYLVDRFRHCDPDDLNDTGFYTSSMDAMTFTDNTVGYPLPDYSVTRLAAIDGRPEFRVKNYEAPKDSRVVMVAVSELKKNDPGPDIDPIDRLNTMLAPIDLEAAIDGRGQAQRVLAMSVLDSLTQLPDDYEIALEFLADGADITVREGDLTMSVEGNRIEIRHDPATNQDDVSMPAQGNGTQASHGPSTPTEGEIDE